MDNSTEKRDKFLECPLGGDETNDCADCIYSVDYHFVDGNCVKRNKQDDSQDKCLFVNTLLTIVSVSSEEMRIRIVTKSVKLF